MRARTIASKSTAVTGRALPSSTTSRKVGKPKLPTAPPDEQPTARHRPSKSITKTSESERIQPIFNQLAVAKRIAYDSETSGLDWRKNHVVGHVITFSEDPRDSHYLPVRHGPGGNLFDAKGPSTPVNWDGKLHKIEADLIKLLDRKDLTMIGHHLNFDIRFLFRLGYRFRPRHEDTMINMTLINEYTPSFKLEALAEIYKVQSKKSAMIVAYLLKLFPEIAKGNPARDAMGHFWRLMGNDPMAVEYATGDGTTTWQLRDAQMVDICKIDNYRGEDIPSMEQVWDVESRLIPVLGRMSAVGIKIDEGKFAKLRTKVKKAIELGLEQLPDKFNPRSPVDVRDWMETNGHTDWPMTPPSLKFPEGQPSFKEDWLSNYPAGKLIVNVRKLTTLRDSSLLPLMTDHLHNGRVHTTFNQLRSDEFGTITGRLSSNNPNLHAVTKHDEYIGRMHRSPFVPDDGMLWEEVDYVQIEPKLLAYYSRCRVLMEGYLADPPIDAHTAVAIAANPNWGKMSDSERKYYRNQYAKRINQTIITGGGKKVLVDKYKVPADEVDRVWNDYHREMPEVRTIQKKMEARMKSRGFMLTLLHRRCRLKHRDKSYVALNRALQGGNADIIKLKMVEIDEHLESIGRPLDMLLNCHDAISFQFHPDNRKHLNECLEIMCAFGDNDVIPLDIPITIDVGEGKSWEEATFGPEGKK